MRSSDRVLVVAILALVASPAPPAPVAIASGSRQASPPPSSQSQGDRPLFRGGVELLQLDVSVLDRNRRPVIGLTAADFTLLENGKPKPIRAFTAIQVPASVPAAERAHSTVEPDVYGNRAGEQDGRLVVILMDRSIPPEQPTIAARRIATAAVEALGPNDLAALVSTSGGVPQNLTTNRARLIEAINQRDWSTDLTKEQEAHVGKQDPLSDGRCLCGLCVLETVTRIAEAMQHAPRRHKTVLFIGSRIILQSGPRKPTADVGCERPLVTAQQKMQEALARAHVTVHSIDPTGLSTLAASAGIGGGKPGEARLKRVEDQREATAELLQKQGSLEFLPELTGGRVVVNTNGPQEKVPDIFAESAAYYVLAFEPDARAASASGTSIEVKVSRPDVRVHTQRKYQTAPEHPATPGAATGSDPLTSAVRGLLPVAGRPLTLAAAASAGAGSNASVIVNVDVGAFAKRATTKPLRFALSAMDQTGREIKSAINTATVAFTQNSPDVPPEANVQTTLELPPGNYEIRMAVQDPADGTVGSVFAPVKIPPFGTASLSMSDVIVQASGGVPQDPSSLDMALSPTTRRTFAGSERIRGVVEIYQGRTQNGPVVPVSLRSRILDSSGHPVREHLRTFTANDFDNRTAIYAADMSLLPSGRYVLTIESSIDASPVTRSIPFAVR